MEISMRIKIERRSLFPILNFICETNICKEARKDLISAFLKFVDASEKYKGKIWDSGEMISFPMEKGKMYMSFSLIFPNEQSLVEFCNLVNNI